MSRTNPFVAGMGAWIAVATWATGLTLGQSGQQQDTDSVVNAVQQWLASQDRPPLNEQSFAVAPLTRQQAAEVARLLWADYRKQLQEARQAEWQAKSIRIDDLEMKFEYRVFGESPPDGRSLFISMHGGGGTAGRVNDQQWRNQIRLYQPKEGVYLAPRAPTDEWNMWHQSHIDRFFERIIQDGILFQNVNANRVYLMGYSAGGDGVYQLAPRMADYLAAAAMMAGHPNDASPLGLRNIGFTIHVGGQDQAYNRNEVASQWKTKLEQLHESDPGGYRHQVVIHDKLGHWMQRQDAVAVDWMSEFTRNPRPDRIVWHQSPVLHDQFYWLAVDPPETRPGCTLIVKREGQKFVIESAQQLEGLTIQLNDQIVDLDQSVAVEYNGRPIFDGKAERTANAIDNSIRRRFDPEMIYPAQIRLKLAGTGQLDE